MRRNSRSLHPVARRVAMASMTVLAASGIGLVAAPMAFGQVVLLGGPLLGGGQTSTVTNSGSASANSGGNTAVGNGSTNSIGVSTPAGTVSVPVSVGNLTNTSDGSATVTSGSATAVGNSSDTAAGQSSSGNLVNSFLGGQAQSSGVTNAGSASANSGGNTAVGNGSQNTQTVTQNVTGGLVGVGVTVGAPTNNSTGTATITSGAANAAGNTSATNVGQSALQGGGGPGGFGAGPGGALGAGTAPCSNGRFTPLQDVAVRNQGQALADTGNNSATGNASTNNNTIEVTGTGATGGVAGVGLTVGAPVNNSSGNAVITTGPATAIGNSSVTQVGQTVCPQVTTLAGGRPVPVVPAGRAATAGTLARTGIDTGDLGMMAGALVGVGILLMASQRRRVAARTAAVPMAGFGFGLGGNDWDGVVG